MSSAYAVCGSIFGLGIGQWGNHSFHRNRPTGTGMYREGTLSTGIDRSADDGGDPAYTGEGLAGYYEPIGGLAVKHGFSAKFLTAGANPGNP